MISLCIKNNNSKIINTLNKNISLINLENIIYSTKTFSKYKNIIIHYTGSNIPEFYNEIANSICNCIIQCYEPNIRKKTLYSNYFYFSNPDIEQIENNCSELLSNSDTDKNHFSSQDTTNHDFSDRKIELWTIILKYITSHKSIVLDGFVNFRISAYLEYLDSAIDSAVNQFVIDKEYFDFIDLLKLYINSNSPLTDFVHLIYKNGEAILLDKNKNLITPAENNLNLNYLSDISFSSNDYALNTLLQLEPATIVIHLVSPADDFINTIQLIFENRVQICTDCSICQIYKMLKIQT